MGAGMQIHWQEKKRTSGNGTTESDKRKRLSHFSSHTFFPKLLPLGSRDSWLSIQSLLVQPQQRHDPLHGSSFHYRTTIYSIWRTFKKVMLRVLSSGWTRSSSPDPCPYRLVPKPHATRSLSWRRTPGGHWYSYQAILKTEYKIPDVLWPVPSP